MPVPIGSPTSSSPTSRSSYGDYSGATSNGYWSGYGGSGTSTGYWSTPTYGTSGHGGRYGPGPEASPSGMYGGPGSSSSYMDFLAGINASIANQLGQPQNAGAMAGFNNAGWSNLFSQLMTNSNYNAGVGSAYGDYNLGLQSIGLDRDKINYQLGTLGRDAGFLNNEKGYVDRLRALLGRDYKVTTGEVNRQAGFDTTINNSDYTSRGAWFAPFRQYKNINIEEKRKADIEQAGIARDRGNVNLDQQLNSINREIAGLADRRFDLNNAAQRLGIDEARLRNGLSDTLRQLGLDRFLTLNDLEGDRSKMTSEQAAFYNSVLQLAFQNFGANPDYWVSQGTPTSAGYHRPVRPIL